MQYEEEYSVEYIDKMLARAQIYYDLITAYDDVLSHRDRIELMDALEDEVSNLHERYS